jgi:hypothetical protein
LRDVRLPPRRKWDFRSSGNLRNADRQLVTHVSGQPIVPIFKGQAVQEVAVFFLSEIDTKDVNTLCGQNVEFSSVKPGGT